MTVIKIANLQSALGFPVLVDVTSKSKHHFSTATLAQRALSISRHLQIRKVKDVELIRVGGSGDGGYVMLDNLKEIEGVLSFGVGPDISWDLDISRKTPLIHLYDHTVAKLPVPISNAIWFNEKVVASKNSTGTTIEEAIDRLSDSNNLILKSDIEDSEWEIFANCREETLLKFDQIVIEFHWLTEKIFTDQFDLMYNAFEKLSRTHSVINIHGNNYAGYEVIANCPIPSVIEVTYARTASYKFEILHNQNHLNRPNFDGNPEIRLSFPISL